jgi:hypothetical protein
MFVKKFSIFSVYFELISPTSSDICFEAAISDLCDVACGRST